MTNTESFIDSLVFKVKHLLEQQDENEPISVSYTHLTLPTILLV